MGKGKGERRGTLAEVKKSCCFFFSERRGEIVLLFQKLNWGRSSQSDSQFGGMIGKWARSKVAPAVNEW